MNMSHLLFGRVKFREDEEYLEFKYKFLLVIILAAAVLTALFVIGNTFEVNPLNTPHVTMMKIFIALSVVLAALRRGHKQRFAMIAWAYTALVMVETTSSLLFVPTDELRIFWFVTNIPGLFILLGRKPGWIITVLSIAIVIGTNSRSMAPYSPNAVATFSLGLLYFAAFFHIYTNRSISYFERMRSSNEKLRHMATHDTLTGVFNARAYYQICDRLIRVASRNGDPYAVMFVDLDHFKSVNDTYGHAAGDTVLKSVAACLSQNIRKSDSLGRIGGEEFSIFLPNTDEKSATDLAESIRTAIEALMPDIGEQKLKITSSIGVARSRPGDHGMQDIQHKADQAMYVAKSKGRNRVSVFTDETDVVQPVH
jgi:diguanylate cyclase (GGDEF)-like protein